MKKSIYIDIMEKVLEAYKKEDIDAYINAVKKNGLTEHGYPRVVANLGILLARGKRNESKETFCDMMDLCLDEMPTARARNGFDVGNDFSVKEIVFCLLELEKAGVFDKEITDGWRKKLSELKPLETYSMIAPIPPVKTMNWAAFGAASEQARAFAGLPADVDFIENQIKSQMFAFDENGMYRDPTEPMAYDFVTRLQLALALYCGYDGETREALEEEFIKAADLTLQMQSVTGEIPFGGRSVQFLHNETFYAALCEFYASFYKKRGDMKKAGQFKRAAKRSIDALLPWLSINPIRHIKNYYATDSMYGCETYAYFDKYMVTAGSWCYFAYLMADDSIESLPCPAETENGIYETSEHFHKVFCKYNDYFIEFETAADPIHDANGLGRVHKANAPSTICMTMPFADAEHLYYKVDIENEAYFAICGAIKTENGFETSAVPTGKYELKEKEVTDEFIRVAFASTLESGKELLEVYTISDSGVAVSVAGDGEVEVLFPAFSFDGENYTEKEASEKSVSVTYKGYRCTYKTDGEVVKKYDALANRNGHYEGYAARGENQVKLQISIEKA